jgi:uncharacterized protein YndB with AHSA1/START domain
MSMATIDSKKPQTDDRLVTKSLFVAATPERAFDVFTRDLGKWWPLETHHIAKTPGDVFFELVPGGRCYEKGKDGDECQWGTVTVIDRPRRFVFVWSLGADFKFDPALHTEVEVTFTPENAGTRVVLEHRMLRAYGDKAEHMQKTLGEGWGEIFALYAKYAASSS